MNATILVVDDEIFARRSVRLFLQENGFNVLDARDGKEALTLLDANKVDLVITDIMMPRLNGLLLLDIIKSRFPETPVVIMTALFPELRKTFSSDNVLLKPIALEELLLKVQTLLNRDGNTRSA